MDPTAPPVYFLRPKLSPCPAGLINVDACAPVGRGRSRDTLIIGDDRLVKVLLAQHTRLLVGFHGVGTGCSASESWQALRQSEADARDALDVDVTSDVSREVTC